MQSDTQKANFERVYATPFARIKRPNIGRFIQQYVPLPHKKPCMLIFEAIVKTFHKCVSLAPRIVYYQEIRTMFGFEVIRSHGCVRTMVHNYYHLVSVLKQHGFVNTDDVVFEIIIMTLRNVLFPM